MKYIILFFFIVSCSAQKTSTKASGNNENLTLILSDLHSNIAAPQILVIEEVSSLRTFFATVNKTRKPGLAFPKVDFSKEQIIIYARGENYSTAIPQLRIVDEDSSVVFIECSSQEPLASTEVMASPFAMYRIKKTAKQLQFVKAD
ncbi:hypothetical protein [Cellulophaga baltica]|jgi:hypothetical protein|uniref:PrcB C-terminal domain-containing protein n=1 Tax=Cellulophaga baltica TaxID=76594 RepID=A0A1G7K3J3_9FLAO|nr:hypothetical protein [Cellulophaga baltica]SDF31614.1 hypothetical protein SAMN04487992_11164 [Cellulophaga baltica]